MSLEESHFIALADPLLERLAEAIEDGRDDADAELEGGVLTVTLDHGGTYVINKQTPNREIWLASPKSGAHHFVWRDERWVSTRDPALALLPLLSAELGVPLT
ncbi:iron donor protein CyaY [Magnetospirillum fulvum]|uniref:Frataxin n=1 Tax=Magnetospirillum fulvum TaxID=1082 RepID=A0A1H6II92_MAGFU|nr:iron donor protein CyaY [Magnetospirillum fulvum]SEH48667.1 frataxin [Magnetospirillum fulvum]